MPYSALERMLRPERYRQRAASRGGFATPSLCKTSVGADARPLLATNMRSTFLPTRPDVEGLAPFGFSHVPLGQEGSLLIELHRVLWEVSTRLAWPNRCGSVAEAVTKARSQGVDPKTMVLSSAMVERLLGPSHSIDTARQTMSVQGFVAVVDGMQLLLADLPSNMAFVAAHPASVGIYTRVGDHLGVLLQRVNKSLLVVRDDNVA